MGFMQPEFYAGQYHTVTDSRGECAVFTGDHFTPQQASAELGEGSTIETANGFCWRLSAPGYLDCTEWSAADTLQDAIQSMLAMFGDEFDSEDWQTIADVIEFNQPGLSQWFAITRAEWED